MAESKSASVVFTDGSLLAKNAQAAAGSAKSAADNAYNLANGAQRTADGKNSIYRGSDPSTVPTANLKVGDLYFSDNAAYVWNGSSWEEAVSDTTGKDIHAKVEAAMAESKKSVAELKNNVEAKVKKLDEEIEDNKIKTGNALNFYKEQYYLSNSYTELTGGNWSDEVPTKTEGKYIWSRYVTANVGDPTNQQYSDPVCISGLDGKDGATGPQGPQGVAGPKGADGQTTYVHVAYANSADGKANFSVNYFADALYIGVLTDYTQADSTDYTQYTWSRLKGDTGDQGIPGPKGTDGRTTYVHFAYANIVQLAQEWTSPKFALSTQTVVRFGDEASESWIYKVLPAGDYTASVELFGSDPAFGIYKVVQAFSDFSVTESSGRSYIGQYTDYTQADSTNPASYKWTKIKGDTGPQGPVGPKGDTGDQGIPGPKGIDGQTTYVHFAYANSADGKTDFNVSYFNNALYVGTYTDYTQTDSNDYTKYTWSRLRGDTGATGPQGPQGLQGLQGPKGDQGVQGPKGESSYTHIAYSNSSDGRSDFDVSNGSGKTYIGIYVDSNAEDSVDPTRYTWTLIKGADGADGIPGPKGADGRTPYFHVAYANSSDGTIGFDVNNSDGKLYIGQYTDYTQADSTNPASYRWTKIKGETGPTGPAGPKGDTGSTGFFIGTTSPPNPTKGTVWATNDASGNMVSAKTWNGANWVSTAFTQDLVAGNISATKIVGGELDVNKITVKNAQNIPITSTVSLGQKLSNIEQDADGLTLTVKNKGQNLLRDTDTLPMWGGDKETVDNFTVVKVKTGDDGWYDPISWYNLTTIKPNTDYTLSFWAKADQPADIYSYLYNIGTDTVYMDGSTLSRLTTSYQRFEIHFHTQNFSVGRTVNCLPMRILTKNVTHYIYGCQLEEGTIATAWSPAPEDISALKLTSDSLNAYVKGSRGSKTLEAILSMDPDHSSIAQVVNGQIAAAIGTYSDGTVRIDGKALHINADTKIEDATIKSAMIDSIEADKITTGTLNADHVRVINLDANSITTGRLSGKNIELNGQTTIHGQLNLLPTEQREEDQSIQGFHNAWHWRDSNVFAGNGGLQLQSTIISQQYSNDNTSISGLRGGSSAAITTLAPTYLKFTLYPSWNDVKNNFSNQLTRTYIDAGRIETNDVWVGNFRLKDSKMHGLNDSLYVTNWHGTNFDNAGSVGFQVWSGIGLGQSTIYTPTSDLYIQIGNVGPGLGARYSSSGKVDVHCNRVISQRANSVSSRLSVKTDITPVSYDRALAAVMGTEMYDYRYISDDSGQHYVSGIIDDVNADPQYHMDDMLINKERTARIDANLVGYHHVILQELIKKIDELEIKLKSLETILKEK